MTLQLRTEAGGYSNSQAAETAAMESNTTADKCWREYFMLKNGISTGLQQSANEAAEHPGTLLAEFGGSAAIGAGVALASRGGAGWKVAVGLGLAAMTYSFAKDVAGRMGVIKSAMDDTWQSGAHMRASEQKVASVAGPFLVDLAATSLGAGFGGTLGLAGPELYAAAARARGTSAVEAAMGRTSLAPTYDIGSAFEGASAKSAVVERTMTSDLVGRSAPIAGAPTENFYLRGKLNAAGVWEPVRDIQEVPIECKRLLLEKLRDVGGIMMEPKVANQFIDSVMPVLNRLEPLPANAPQEVVLARAKQVVQAINAFAETNNMPRLKLSLPDASDQASLVAGKMLFDRTDGYIAVKPQDLLRSPGTDGAEMTAARLYHEIGHNKQVYDIFKVESQRLGVPKSGPVDAVLRAELREQMQWRLALGRENITDSYMDRLLQAWQKDTTPITAADRLRAEQLTGGFVRMADPGPQYVSAAQQAAEANRLQQMVRNGGTDGANQALNELRSPAAQRQVFGYSVPDAVTQMTLKPAGTAGAAEAQLLDETLGQFISGRNQLRQTKYLKYMEPPELEAWILQQKALIRAYRFTANNSSAPTIH
jgi:hypothetical protein